MDPLGIFTLNPNVGGIRIGFGAYYIIVIMRNPPE